MLNEPDPADRGTARAGDPSPGSTRHVLLLDLHDDAEAIATYRDWHRPGGPPAAIARAIRAEGIVALEIWQVADRLVMVMETTPDFDPAAKAARDLADPEIQAMRRSDAPLARLGVNFR